MRNVNVYKKLILFDTFLLQDMIHDHILSDSDIDFHKACEYILGYE